MYGSYYPPLDTTGGWLLFLGATDVGQSISRTIGPYWHLDLEMDGVVGFNVPCDAYDL